MKDWHKDHAGLTPAVLGDKQMLMLGDKQKPMCNITIVSSVFLTETDKAATVINMK